MDSRTFREHLQARWRERLGPLWKSRLAATGGALMLGLVALGFAWASDQAMQRFAGLAGRWPYAPLVLTPLAFGVLAWLTHRYAPAARGSGIPQVLAATSDMNGAVTRRLITLRTGAFKMAATVAALAVGASAGREGPTVQVGAAIMTAAHRWLRIPLTPAVAIAGGAAGVSAAFNTPLAGVAFAIEELAAAYEQRLAMLVMAAVMISGFVSLSLAGDYVYFGTVSETLPVMRALVIAVAAGVVGGALGGGFSRILLDGARWIGPISTRPVSFAVACGLIVACVGVLSGGLTWGTGYAAARTLVEGGHQPLVFAPAKLVATIATSMSGVPGGIFAPSLAVGAGVGGWLGMVFPHDSSGAVATLCMIAYFTGVVRAPLTAVVIVSEMTADRAMLMPLFAAAIVADAVAKLVSPERLYHGLAKAFAAPPEAPSAPGPPLAPSEAPPVGELVGEAD
jgi:H+/Cl- antiporter ClcA